MGSMFWLLVVPNPSMACADPLPLIEDFEQSVIDGRYQDALQISEALEEAFGCGSLADPRHMARMWQVEAILALHHEGDEDASDDALLAAGRLSTEDWVEEYGAELRARQLELLLSSTDSPKSRIILEPPLASGHVGAIDGRTIEAFPALVNSGLHLLQVGTTPEQIVFAEVVVLSPESDLVIRTGLPATPPLPMPTPRSPEFLAEATPTPPRKRLLAFGAAAGGGAALAYGVTRFTSRSYNEDPRLGLGYLNNGLAYSSVGLMVASGGLLVWGLATPRQTP